MSEPASPGASGAASDSLEAATRSIARATAGIAFIALLAKGIGFVEKQAIAYYFGTDLRVDAYFVALSVPFLFFLMIRELTEPAFLPVFVQSLRDGEERRGWRLFTFVASLICVVTLGYAAYVSLAAPDVIRRLAPGFGAEAREHGVTLLRIMIPGVVLLGLSTLTYITLNGYRRFVLPASGDLAMKAAPVIALFLLASGMGITALAVGFLLGAVGRLGTHLLGLRPKLRWLAWPDSSSRDDLRQYGWLVLPLVVGAGFSFVSELADNYFSSQIGEGGVSARNFAKKIRDLPIEILPYTLSVVLFPFFAQLVASGDRKRLVHMFSSSVHGLALAFAPVAVGLLLLAEPVVSVALERGAFGAEARALTAWPLKMYAVGMVTFAVETVLVNLFFSLKDTLTPIAVGVVGVGINIGLSALLVHPMGVGGVALALSISKTVKIAILAVVLARKGPYLRWRSVAATCLRLAVAAGVAWIALQGYVTASGERLVSGATLVKAIYLLGGAAVCGGVFVLVAAAIGRRERELIAAAPRFLRLISGRS